jgi:hypothetical protein
VIAGRAANAYTEEDFHQAKVELQREAQPDENEEVLLFEPGSGDVLGGTPKQAENIGAADESTVGEELIREGMSEALHDEMLQARRGERR